MSSNKEFRGDEASFSPESYRNKAINGPNVLNSQFRDPVRINFPSKTQEDYYFDEKEEEKDQIQEINNFHVKASELGPPHFSLHLSRRHIAPKTLPDSPVGNRSPFKSSFKFSTRALDYDTEMRHNTEDSADFTGMNPESLRNTILTPAKKSSRQKTSIPLIKPILENKENLIQRMIEEAEPNTLIHLPATNIILPYLHLTKPITIQGVPGSVIKITEGPILIDLRNKTNKSGDKVVFCECTIHAEYSRQRLLDNINTRSDSRRGAVTQKESEDSFKLIGRKLYTSVKNDLNTARNKLNDSSLVLFQVNSGSALEIRDCEIKSLIKEILATSEESKHINEIEDTALWLHNEDDSLENPIIMVSSTTFSGFHTYLYSEPYCSSSLSKCFMSSSRGHALNIENPKIARITENILERTSKSAINIKFSKDSIDDQPHNISIKNNEIKYSNSYGVSIFGEHLKPLKVSLLIAYNKIYHSKKDSVGIKFLNIPELKISHNEIINSKGNGISLQNVFDSTNSTQVYLRKNVIQSSEANGIVLKDCPVLMENEEIIKNNKNGIFIVLEDYGKDGKDQSNNIYQKLDFRMVLNNCKIHQNQESGLNIAGSLKGPMLLSSCVMSENLYGIFITEKENINDITIKTVNTNTNKANTVTNTSPPKTRERKKSKSQKQAIRNYCHYSIEKCEISKNNIAGIYLKKLVSEMYFTETHVAMNKDQALFMEDFNDRELIKLKEQDKAQISEYFQGYIGGNWGELYQERAAYCKNNCGMF